MRQYHYVSIDEALRIRLKDDEVLFHLWDCGGQPIFLDLLPAFLSSRTVFLLMFDASKSLDEPFQVVINNEGSAKARGSVRNFNFVFASKVDVFNSCSVWYELVSQGSCQHILG